MNSNKETETQIHVFSPTEIINRNRKKESGFARLCKDINNKIKKLFHKERDAYSQSPYKSGVKSLWLEFRRKIIGGTLTALMVIAVCFTVNQLEWGLGYEVIVDGQNIGMVTDKQTVYQAMDEVRDCIRVYLGERSAYDKDAVFVRRIVSKKDIADVDDLRNALLANVDSMVEGYGVYIDGELVFGVSSEKAAKLVFDKYMEKYTGDVSDDVTAEFCEDIQVKKEFMSIGMLETPDDALDILEEDTKNPILSVKTVQTITTVEPVPYEVEKVNDGNVYKGRTVVAQKGKDGQANVVSVVTKVNGVASGKKVVKTETVIEPVKQIEKVGTKTPPPSTGSGTFMKPTYGILTSRYGARWSRQHKGIDIGGNIGTPIKAADGGVVTYAGWMSGYGKYVVINHENGYKTAYGHCDSISVAVGDRVSKGEEIARMGNTGRSTGPHLHFEVIKGGEYVNPLEYVGY